MPVEKGQAPRLVVEKPLLVVARLLFGAIEPGLSRLDWGLKSATVAIEIVLTGSHGPFCNCSVYSSVMSKIDLSVASRCSFACAIRFEKPAHPRTLAGGD